MRCLLVADIHYSLPQYDWVVSESDKYDLLILAGDHLDVSSSVDCRAQSIVVPEDYISRTDRDSFVAYVEEDGVARERALRIGATSKGRMLILEGLSAGDRLITRGYQNVADGQRVVVKN